MTCRDGRREESIACVCARLGVLTNVKNRFILRIRVPCNLRRLLACLRWRLVVREKSVAVCTQRLQAFHGPIYPIYFKWTCFNKVNYG